MLREPHPDAADAISWIAGLGDLAFRAVLPVLSHHLMHAALMIAMGQPAPKSQFEAMRALADDFEVGGPERRCYGFVADVLVHLGLVRREPLSASRQLSLFEDG